MVQPKLQIQIMNLLEGKVRGQNSVSALWHHSNIERTYTEAGEADRIAMDSLMHALTGRTLDHLLGLRQPSIGLVTLTLQDLRKKELIAKQEEKQRIAAYLREESAMHTALGSWLFAKVKGFSDIERMGKALEAVAKKIEERVMTDPDENLETDKIRLHLNDTLTKGATQRISVSSIVSKRLIRRKEDV